MHRRTLGTTAALGLVSVLTAAIGGTTAGALWISVNALRIQAEDTGRQAAVAAATSFTTLAEPSAANIVRTLDIVLHDHLQAQAAATALLVEAAESAGHGSGYIQDALAQIAFRSPIRRIDVTALAGPSYSSDAVPLDHTEVEPAFARLATMPAIGRTAAAAATQTATGLTKAAAAQLMHRPAAVRIEQQLDSLSAARAYGGTDDPTARHLAGQQATAIAWLTTHAIELTEDAGWGSSRIDDRLAALVGGTTIDYIAAAVPDGAVVYEAGETSAVPDEDAPIAVNPAPGEAVALPGRYDSRRRWLTRAAATRANRRLTTRVEVVTRVGDGTLVETAWQTEANRLAEIDGVTGVWVAEIAAVTDGSPDAVRLAAAAPGPSQDAPAVTGAWSRWDASRIAIAISTARRSAPVASSSIQLLSGNAATLLSAAPIWHSADGRAVALVIENRADQVVDRMRRETATGLAGAVALIALLALVTIWTARRWLTRPIEAMAAAARHLQDGERPPHELTTSLQLRGDEIGGLARSFGLMTERVLARHEEMLALVADKTRWLQEANATLTRTHQRIASEIGLAKTVQQAMVPRGSDSVGNLTLCSRMTPARELGGDFINIERHRSGKLLVAVCDVSGKGVAAALFMAVARSTIVAAAGRHDEVTAIAADANRSLAADNPLEMFVTGVIALIDTSSGHVEYVCAGHEPPLNVTPDKRVNPLARADNIPLGLEPDERYSELHHEIARDETIVAYTDGVTDACNADEELFGELRLQELLADTAPASPERMLQQLWTAIELFSGRMAVADDKTCVAVRRNGH